MKMPKLAVLLLLLAAASAQADAVFFPKERAVEPPAVTRFAEWDTAPLIPAGTSSFFTLEVQDARDPNVVIAWGVDPQHNRILWRIALSGYADLGAFANRLRGEEIRASASADPTQPFHWGDMGQLQLPPPPPPPDGPGGDGWIAMRVMHLAKLTQHLQTTFNAPAGGL